MEKTVSIPEGVEAKVEGFKVFIKGKNGNLERDFSSPLFNKDIVTEKSGNTIKISTKSEKRKLKSEIGTIASHIQNMINGVTKGYIYKLKIIYMHFPMTVKISGKEISISNFLGEKQPRKANVVGDSKVEVNGDEVIVTGINKEEVGQTAANIEKSTWIKARDRRVFSDGIFITEKSD
jgi:large subunit ribosomal protein L6